MYEALYITKLLQLIERKVNWGSSQLWTYEDYKKLQKLVFEASSINLSTHTLERLYGKLKTHKNYKPQAETKKALAVFLNYADWDDFKNQNPLTIREINSISNPDLVSAKTPEPHLHQQKFKSRKLTKAFLLLALICAGAVAGFVFFNKNSNNENVNFKAINAFSAPPHTVKFVYDLSRLEGDDFSILFPENNDTVRLSKADKVSYKAYMYPGRYAVYLLQNKKPIAQTSVYIQTAGWLGGYYSTYEDESTKRLLSDTSLLSGGRLYTHAAGLPDSITSKTYYISYLNIRDFNLDGDNASFETRFKSTPSHGSKLCYDMWFKLLGTGGILKMHFLESGCFGHVQMIFGDKPLRGNKYDLSPFSINMQSWEKVRLKVVNKHIQVYLNDKLIYKTGYSKSVGKIVGIEITSKTSGETDYVKLYDAKQKLVYTDDFGGKAIE